MEDTATPTGCGCARRRFVPTIALPLALCALAVAPGAFASGHMPGFPIPPRSFADYAACKAFLEQTARDDRARAEPQPRETEPGVTRQTLVISDGVTESGEGQAAYRVQVGAQFRRRDEARESIVTTFSYDENSYRCNGGELSGESGARGYHLPGYEPIPAPAR
ncbi:hypothetical protein [Lysobacter enzymogenes]|uniref:hypothetical protein n=1 Tax=Lysobacter enzymogenes TaxID=69 RepID=UPI0009CB8E5F|nr:hypothetical protein [Lysobacter enzymogenes]UZW62596.1 hypothetical protein BV903_010035 [Lysobacter enzymogenes]